VTPNAAPPPVVSNRQALEILSRAGEVLTGSLALVDTIETGLQLVVPAIADWAAVVVEREDGSVDEITSRHADPEVEAALRSVRRRRREETGGSESLAVAESGEPILASDISGTSAEDVEGAERAALERLDPRSYMLVPLAARGRIFGALTLLSATPGRHYTREDLGFAATLAGRFALAIDNARLYEAASRSLGLLDTLFDTAPVGFAFIDTEQCYVRINEALAAMNGGSVSDHVGRRIDEVLGPESEAVLAAHRQVLETGEPLLEQEMSTPQRTWVSSYTPVRGLGGELLGVGVVVIDITERRRLLARTDFLARAGALLDASLDYEETLSNVARLAVPEIADWCSIKVLDADGRLQPVVTAHTDPTKEPMAADYERRYPPDPDAEGGEPAVARTGVSVLLPEITDDMLSAAITDPERLAVIRQLALRSVIIVPLSAHQQHFGSLTLVSAESGRVFGEAELRLAEQLGRQAGVAIDNARLYTERLRIAHTLQARLLPDHLPAIPGARLAARYRAAGELNEVGGDFYDVFARPNGEWVLVVGDVAGKGAEAAAVTALARYTLRSAAQEPGPPSEALRRLNAAMLAEAAHEFVTVALAYVAPQAPGGLRVRLALGGHLPALLLDGEGNVEARGELGGMLGVGPEPPLPDSSFVIPSGSLLLLYTDGVTEAGPRTDPVGENGLARLLASLRAGDPDAVVQAVERAAVDAQPGEPRDDVAALAIAAD
jgi:PAS domain S-box-containing protein